MFCYCFLSDSNSDIVQQYFADNNIGWIFLVFGFRPFQTGTESARQKYIFSVVFCLLNNGNVLQYF